MITGLRVRVPGTGHVCYCSCDMRRTNTVSNAVTNSVTTRPLFASLTPIGLAVRVAFATGEDLFPGLVVVQEVVNQVPRIGALPKGVIVGVGRIAGRQLVDGLR